MISENMKNAFTELCMTLHGRVPEKDEFANIIVKRSDYKQAMLDVEERYGITEGDPDFFLWLLFLLTRSPRFTEDEGEQEYG